MKRAIPKSFALGPLQERRAPGKSRPKAGKQHVVSALHASVADRLFERERDGRARRVAVLVDVDRHAVERKADAARGGIDDAEVGLVRNPEVDLVERHPRGLAYVRRLADEDVDRELEDVRADHLDVGVRVLCRVRALLDVAAGHLRVSTTVRAETLAQATRAT